MKSILLIVASLFNTNQYINYTDNINFMFGAPVASFHTMDGGLYNYLFTHEPEQMSSGTLNTFKSVPELYIDLGSDFNIDNNRREQFYIQVGNEIYSFENEFDYGTPGFYVVVDLFETFIYDQLTTITISIPTTDTIPFSNYQSALSDTTFYTREAYVQHISYNEGYYEGLYDGYGDYNDGWADGFDHAVEYGHADKNLSGLFGVLSNGFSSIASILSIQLFPGFTIGLLLFLPLMFGIAYTLLKLLLGSS